MIDLKKLVEIGFTISQATDLSIFFRNVGYLTVGTDSVLTGVTVPDNKIIEIDSTDTLNQTLKSDSQEYMDISRILIQSGNTEPNRGRVNSVVVYFATKGEGEGFGDLVDKFVSVNGNWAQLLINSNEDDDIKAAAEKALSNDRLFVAQTASEDVANAVGENIAKVLAAAGNDNVLLTYHTTANESLAAGLAGIMANPNLGAVGSLYSTVTNVTPEDYTATVNTNLDNQNIVYYSNVNAINGGSVEQYASPIVTNGYTVTGEDAKRRYIRFYIDKAMKARSIDFLKKKLGYEDSSADVLLSMLKSVLKGCQTNGLIKQDVIRTSGDSTINQLGYELATVYPTELREQDETLYNAQTYVVKGYYRDSLTGRKVEIELFVDPSDTEKSQLGF